MFKKKEFNFVNTTQYLLFIKSREDRKNIITFFEKNIENGLINYHLNKNNNEDDSNQKNKKIQIFVYIFYERNIC